jgi:dynamin 1-like protein
MLPQVVVVGSQSCGKSSVLESIIGKEFLPRGKGVVTRRPLQIELKCTPGANSDYAEFMHRPNERYHDFDKVRNEIQSETLKGCGANTGINFEPIYMRIFSRNVVDITLVDLPGITQNPVGDQPPDIKERIEGCINSYIK